MSDTKLIELTLPFHLQALRAPVKWKMEPPVTMSDGEQWTWLTPIRVPAQGGSSYDPWKMRAEFLRLGEGDNAGLVALLDKVGYYSSGAHPINTETFLEHKPVDPNSDEPRVEISYVDGEDGSHPVFHTVPEMAGQIWSFRQHSILRSMRFPRKYPLNSWKLEIRLAQLRGKPAAVITTTCFEDSLVATVLIDQMLGAKFQKCQRPDCGNTFAVLGNRKRRFCSYYCAHLVAVRADHERKRQQKQGGQKHVRL